MAASDRPAATAAPIRWGRVFALLALLALVGEAISQGMIYAYAGRPFQSLSVYRWSPYGLVRNNPGLTSPGYEIDRSGFRSLGEYQKKKPPGTLRVLLLGGSVLYSGLAGARLERYGRVGSNATIAPFLEALFAKDPTLAGRKVEVINAAVNFNRIVEIASAYLEEYIAWDADLVVVFGGINNFFWFREAGDFAAGRTTLQAPHPFRLEFERLVNEQSAAAFVERAWRTGAEHSALLALAYKGSGALADRLVALAARLAPARPPRPDPALRPETPAEQDAYMRLYASYADAMIAAARAAGQGIVFVWEPALAHLVGVKPLSDEEHSLADPIRNHPNRIAQFEASRQAFHRILDRQGVPVIDPTDALRAHPGTVFIDYVHYTPDGNRFMAEVAYPTLRAMLARRLNGPAPAPPK
ncbi:hypothetical protein [Reyranella sp.]|uniref:hypothetical protein n=1 Tax=Reyranella sp. TaxID=1929291 RepID=UPI003BAC3304